MPTSKKKMALLNGLDQYSAYYSVICVFGSVVGCVVVPLITQSIEGIILSAIVISLTAKTIHSRSLALRDDPAEERKRGGPKENSVSDTKKTKKKKSPLSTSRGAVDNEVVRRQREEDLLRLHKQRNIDRQQKFEEKKLKKARKREEKMKIKEEEEKEKMRDTQQRREREERKTQQKLRKMTNGMADSTESLLRPPPAPRERKNSSSSSGSARSNRTLPRQRPPRMTARTGFSRASSDSNIPPQPSPLPLSPQFPPHIPPSLQGPLPPPLETLTQSKQVLIKKQELDKNKLQQKKSDKVANCSDDDSGVTLLPTNNHSSNNNLTSSPPSSPPANRQTKPHHRTISAVNPLAPSNSVTTAMTSSSTTPIMLPGGGGSRPVTVGTRTVVPQRVGYNWNEQLYFWSLDQAGLTRPLQYGWDPVAPPNLRPPPPPPPLQQTTSNNAGLQLRVQPTSTVGLWRGPLSAPGAPGHSSSQVPPPPPPQVTASFGAIGNVSSTPPTDTLPRQQQPLVLPQESESKTGDECISGGYSLFSGNGQTIFGKSLLNNGQALPGKQPVSTETSVGAGVSPTNERGSPKKGGRFDEWPAL